MHLFAKMGIISKKIKIEIISRMINYKELEIELYLHGACELSPQTLSQFSQYDAQ